LTIPEQLALSKRCINEYYKKPNRTNLYIYDPKFNQNKEEPLPTSDKKLFVVDDPKKDYFNTQISNMIGMIESIPWSDCYSC